MKFLNFFTLLPPYYKLTTLLIILYICSMVGIYKITAPDNKVYIGQSSDIEKRWIQYKRYYAENQPKLKQSFFRHGIDNHKFEIICECSLQEINSLEMYYISIHDSINQLNSNPGNNTIKKQRVLNLNKDFEYKERKKKIVKPLKNSKAVVNNTVKEYLSILSFYFTADKPTTYLTATEIKTLLNKINPKIEIISIVHFGRALKIFFGNSVCRRVNNKILYRYSIGIK